MERLARGGPPRTLPKMVVGFRLVAGPGDGVWRVAGSAGAYCFFFHLAAFGRANGARAQIGPAGAQRDVMERAVYRTPVAIETRRYGVASARGGAARRLSHDRNDSRRRAGTGFARSAG